MRREVDELLVEVDVGARFVECGPVLGLRLALHERDVAGEGRTLVQARFETCRVGVPGGEHDCWRTVGHRDHVLDVQDGVEVGSDAGER